MLRSALSKMRLMRGLADALRALALVAHDPVAAHSTFAAVDRVERGVRRSVGRTAAP